ncbi:DEAD/DEAH box helicase family protein [Kitasatospora sp. NPDC001132]
METTTATAEQNVPAAPRAQPEPPLPARPLGTAVNPLPLHWFQKDAVAAAVREVKDGGRATVIAATGSGKTLIAAGCARRLAARGRVLLPLFTLVFWPRVRTLELLRSPRLYERHLRRHLAKGDNYRYDSAGRILRRVAVKLRHHRGAGAWAVLRIAAEHGWTLDHSFPADPSGTLHLCRLEERTRWSR